MQTNSLFYIIFGKIALIVNIFRKSTMHKYLLFTLIPAIILFSCTQNKSTDSNENETDSLFLNEIEESPFLMDDHVSEVDVSNEIKFPIAYIWNYEWEYTDEYQDYEDDAIDNEGEVWAFYEPIRQYWLFSRESSFGVLGAMNEWVLCKPDGTYIFQEIDEHGKRSLSEVKIEYQTPDKLTKHYTPTGRTKKYEYAMFNNITFVGKEYIKTYEKTSDETTVYLVDSDINFAPIYNFNELDRFMEIRLPFYFPYELPANKLLLEEITDMPYGKGKVVLQHITPTEYYIYPDLSKTEKLDLNSFQ